MKAQHERFQSLAAMSIMHPAYRKGYEQLLRCYENVETNKSPTAIAVLGESGTGKSKLLRSIVDKYPPIDTNTSTYVPIVFFDLMPKPTTKKIYQEILKSLGAEHYYKGTEAELRHRCWTLLKACETRIIMLDEYQRLIERSSRKVIHDVAELTKEFIDRGVGVVMAGIQGCENIFNADSQLRRRMMSNIYLNRFDYSNLEDRSHFVSILATFDKYIRERNTLDVDLPRYAPSFYCASGGLIGYITIILESALDQSINTNQSITLSALNQSWIMNINDHKVWNGTNLFSQSFNILDHPDFLLKCSEVGKESRSLDFNN